MKSQAYRMALLYDFLRGRSHPPGRRSSTTSTIMRTCPWPRSPENNGITRQGVRDVIVRAEAILTDLEDKTGLIKRFHAMQKQLQEVEGAAQAILARSARYDDRSWRPRPARSWALAQQMEKE